MYPISTDGRLQVMAGISLIERSRLMWWNACTKQLMPTHMMTSS